MKNIEEVADDVKTFLRGLEKDHKNGIEKKNNQNIT